MSSIRTLKDSKVGQKVKVIALIINGPIRRRLLDIGLVEGTEVECVLKSPSGDPVAFLIRGAVIALREEITSKILCA